MRTVKTKFFSIVLPLLACILLLCGCSNRLTLADALSALKEQNVAVAELGTIGNDRALNKVVPSYYSIERNSDADQLDMLDIYVFKSASQRAAGKKEFEDQTKNNTITARELYEKENVLIVYWPKSDTSYKQQIQKAMDALE